MENFLKQNADVKFTARQIAEWIYKTYPEKCLEKQRKSSAKAIPLDTTEKLISQIVAEIGSQRPALLRRNPQIKITESRPKKYYFTEESDQEEIEIAESSSKTGFKEFDLYPLLAEFLQFQLGLYSKRINEKRSSNNHGLNGNKWLYPDLVGMQDLSADWHLEVKNCIREYSDHKTKLWSFEVKKLINRSNVREVFFQTVSNSSWANFGYLVAAEIQGPETEKELRILSSLHGIGCIQLETKNPADSIILIPAIERHEIDWDTINRLVKENKDFLDFIKSVRHFYQTGDIKANDWIQANSN